MSAVQRFSEKLCSERPPEYSAQAVVPVQHMTLDNPTCTFIAGERKFSLNIAALKAYEPHVKLPAPQSGAPTHVTIDLGSHTTKHAQDSLKSWVLSGRLLVADENNLGEYLSLATSLGFTEYGRRIRVLQAINTHGVSGEKYYVLKKTWYHESFLPYMREADRSALPPLPESPDERSHSVCLPKQALVELYKDSGKILSAGDNAKWKWNQSYDGRAMNVKDSSSVVPRNEGVCSIM